MAECFLIGVIILQSVLHYAERRDLYTRIMCSDAADYKSITKGENKKTVRTAHKRVLDSWRKSGDK